MTLEVLRHGLRERVLGSALLVGVVSWPATGVAQSQAHAAAPDGQHVVGGMSGLPIDGLTGEAAFDAFGQAFTAEEDVDGDGFHDVVVGAPYNDAGGTNAGRVYVFRGGPGMDAAPDFVFYNDTPQDLFGAAVAVLRDWNGDGHSDVVIGAPANRSGGSRLGRVFVYLGSDVFDNQADIILEGPPDTDFGAVVASAGDIDGDGLTDLLVGAPGHAADAGRVYLYLGRTVPSTQPDVIFEGAEGASLGASLAGGDVNGDGLSDVVLGAPGVGEVVGAVQVVFGSPAPRTEADLTIRGVTAVSDFGRSVDVAGDLNGDGFDDLAVGAPNRVSVGAYNGLTYVFFGGPGIDAVPDLSPFTGRIGYGHRVSGVGDVDGDGYDDLAVGSWQQQKVHVYRGGQEPDTLTDILLSGGPLFGVCLGGADLDGDGRSEVLAGQLQGGQDRGSVAVYTVSTLGFDTPDEEIRDYFPGGDDFGWAIATAGDVNADGRSDIVVGNPRHRFGTTPVYASIWLAFASGTFPTAFHVTSGFVGDEFGYAVAGGGDVDADGTPDVAIGAPEGAGGGRAYVFMLTRTGEGIRRFDLSAPGAGGRFGSSTAVLDFNGDGIADVAVGAPDHVVDGVVRGQVSVYLGSPSFDSEPDLIIDGPVAGGQFGYSLAGIGDFNADGYDDLLVGAPVTIAAGGHAGSAYAFFGGSAPDSAPDLVLNVSLTGDRFGHSVAAVGDVNGDGHPDLGVGAPGVSGAPDAGRVYIFHGGPGPDAAPDATIVGGETARLGWSLAGVGDVNSDGFDDVLAGRLAAPARLLLGGHPMGDVGLIQLGGSNAHSVAGVGDLNGDGTWDMLVGAPDAEVAGRVLVYFSTFPPVIPRIVSVNDVPDDQGGFAEVEWTRSAYDAEGIARVVGYRVERSADGMFWEPAATVAATEQPRYRATAPTYFIEGDSAHAPTRLRVTAVGASSDESWSSTRTEGTSTDDVPPPPPADARLTRDGQTVRLEWSPSVAPDVAGYTVHRSAARLFEPGPSTGVAFVRGTEYTETIGGPVDTLFYRIVTRDIHGNDGEATPPVSTVDDSALPIVLALGPPTPNPARQSVAFLLELPAEIDVTVSAFDAMGRRVWNTEWGATAAGRHFVSLDATSLAAGAYVVRVSAGEAGGGILARRFTVLR